MLSEKSERQTAYLFLFKKPSVLHHHPFHISLVPFLFVILQLQLNKKNHIRYNLLKSVGEAPSLLNLG
jgi:hypothetical protein